MKYGIGSGDPLDLPIETKESLPYVEERNQASPVTVSPLS